MTRLVLHLCSVLLIAQLAACAALPPREPVAASYAVTDADGTALARIAEASRPAGETAASGFRLLPLADHAFDARAALARHAERTIDAQYYHIHADRAGATFLRELRDAADRGVRVRLLVDDYYAAEIQTWLAGLAEHAGAQVRLFNPIPERSGSPLQRLLLSAHEFERINHRMHNKLFIADNALAVFGGRNIADEYFRLHREANFIDLDLLASGEIVKDLSRAFDLYWNSEHAYPLHQVVPRPPDAAAAREEFARDTAARRLNITLADQDPSGLGPVSTQLAVGRLELTFGAARVFADAPSKVREPVIADRPSAALRGQLDVIGQARSEAVVVSPYLVPHDLGIRMIGQAHRRGVRIKLFTNSLGSTDEPLTYWYYARKRRQMLREGAEIYELSPTLPRVTGSFGAFGHSRARLHAKVGIVDQRWLLVGSVNMDARSATLNTELGVAIDSAPLAELLLKLLAADKLRSVYSVRLGADERSEQWSYVDTTGQPVVIDRDPDLSDWQRFKLWLQSWFVDETLM